MLLVLSVAVLVIYSVARPNVALGPPREPEEHRSNGRTRRRVGAAASAARTAGTVAASAARTAGTAAASAAGTAGTVAAGAARTAAAAASSLAQTLQPAPPGDAVRPDPALDLDEADAVVHDAVCRVESGITARSVPSQQGSPMATPAAGVSETISG
jgi:hypothetical protein